MNKRQKIVQEAFLNNEEAVIKRLKQVYNVSLDDITKKSQELQNQIYGLQQAFESVEDEAEKARLKSMQQSKIYQKQYQDAMKKQINSILDNMQVEEFKTVSDYLNKCYEEGFMGTMYDLQGQGIPLCFPMDQEAVVRAVQLDSKIKQGYYTRLGEDVSMLKKKITATVSRGIATGMTFPQMAQQLSDYTRIGFNNAVRIARTEGHRIQVQSGMDACYKAKEKGADVVKQWDSTLDSSTRESHVAVDGEIRELDEKFSNGLMYPSDPSGKAEEVINCRCALLQRARWAVDDKFTKMNNETGELVDFKNIDDYNEFKKKYMKHVEDEKAKNKKPLEKNGKKDNIKLRINLFDKDDPIYLDAISIEEEEGFEDICSHASPSSIQITIDGKKTNMNASTFAKYLKESANYKGGDIRLAACSAGYGDNSFAQQLSKELGVRVKAADADVYYAPDEGTLFVGSPYKNTGKWRIFNNGVEE